MLPRITAALLTFENGKRNTAEVTLRSALDNLRYSGELAVHIADDGSVAGHVERLREIAGGYSHVVAVGSTNVERRGYAASFNAMTQTCHSASECFLILEDDWRLECELDLDPLVDTLQAGIGIQCIRLGYMGFTQALFGEFVHTPAGIMAVLDGTSPERHVAAGHPRLETRDWERGVGPWAEGLAPGATEFDWCGRQAARQGVAFPLDLLHPTRDPLFAHIGGISLGELEPGT